MTAAGQTIQHVGMGAIAVTRAPGTLEIRGLGSCIALALHDPLQRLAGLAHVVIPRPLPTAPPAIAWAATTAVPALLEAMERQGGRTGRLVARIAGGSTMFPGPKKGYEVGPENADIVEALLHAYKIPILSRQVGGRESRSVTLHAEDGRLDVRTVAPTPRRRARAEGTDPGEGVRILLESIASPLSDILQRPVVVEAAGRYDLTQPETIDFLGTSEMRWSRTRFTSPQGAESLHLAIPELHAERIDEELRQRLPEGVDPGAAIDEVLNIMLTHGVTALARLRAATLRSTSMDLHRGTTRELVASLGANPAAKVRVAHARIHLEGSFRGAEMALLGGAIP